MKKSILAIIFLTSAFVYGQQYKTAIGFKGGFPGYGAINVKHFLHDFTAVEARFGGGGNMIFLQGLYEQNKPLQDDFEWYWGAGADLGVWTVNYLNNGMSYTGANGGLDGVVGIEYTFSQFPVNVAFDMGPSLRLFPYVGFTWGGGLAARFTLK
jgi:hypothetical protein